jgi:hypothetical protein
LAVVIIKKDRGFKPGASVLPLKKSIHRQKACRTCREPVGDAHASVQAVLDRFAEAAPGEASLRHVQPFIERVFGAGHPVTRIRDELERAESSGNDEGKKW